MRSTPRRLQRGGTSDGAPGLRPQHGDGYYAAFIRDPDGNRIEAVTFVEANSLEPLGIGRRHLLVRFRHAPRRFLQHRQDVLDPVGDQQIDIEAARG